MIYGVTFNQILQMPGLKLTEQDVPCCSPLLSPAPTHHLAVTSSSPQHHIPTPHPAIARGKNASFSFNTKIRTLSRTSICQVPLVSQRFHFALWIHTLWLLMIKSLERMGGAGADIFYLFFWRRAAVGVRPHRMLTLTL